MSDYRLTTQSIDVPKSTGIEGFMHTVRELLKLPRIQRVEISARGKVTYERYVTEGEQDPLGVDFTGIEPWHIARNAPDGVEELLLNSRNAAVIIMAVLDRATSEKLYPTCFVASPNSLLGRWYQGTTGFAMATKDFLCGLPLHLDRHIPDAALILCASFAKGGALVDTQKAYKIEMNHVVAPQTEVEVLND